MEDIRKIDDNWVEEQTARGTWKYRDLSGERLGVRIEVIMPGETSSEHHFHTAEEEHVIALEGCATLVLGADCLELNAGDHVWFKAGEAIAHHIENTSGQPFRFLVFGERNSNDIVFYPDREIAMVKALGREKFTIQPGSSGGAE